MTASPPNVLTCSIMAGAPSGLALGLLPLVVFASITALIAGLRPPGPGRLRESLLIAATAVGVWVVAGTEVLSLFNAISFWPIVGWWSVPAVILCAAAWINRQRTAGLLSLPRPAPWGVWAPLGITGGLLLLAGVVGALSPPNAVDSMVYHMPRQIYWMQQQNVGHYPTPVFMQLAMPPMVEFASLHMMILSGGDVYSGMIQWPFMVLAALAASLIARELGGQWLAQSMAALLVVTNPLAWMQSTNVKNDVATSLWVLVAAWCVARIMRDGSCGPQRWMLLGAAAGLAVATKLTGIVFSVPLLGALGIWLLVRRQRWVDWPFRGRLVVLPLGATVLGITLALNAPQFLRNLETFGTLHGSSEIQHRGRGHTNETRAPVAIASVAIRNIALHCGTPSPAANRAVVDGVRRVHRVLGADINDPRTTIYEDFRIWYMPWSESVANAPVHLLLTFATLALVPAGYVLSRRRKAHHPRSIPHAEAARLLFLLTAAVSAFLLFCIMFKWQPWNARLHVGLFALMTPIIATAHCRGRGVGALVVCAALMVPMVPSIVWNERRPLVGPRSVLWTPRDDLRVPESDVMDEMINFLRRARPGTLGLIVRPFEYTVQQRVLRDLDEAPVFCAPNMPLNRQFRQPLPQPDLVIVSVNPEHVRGWIRTQTMYQVARAGPFLILAPEEVAQRLYREGIIDHVPEEPWQP